MVQKIIAMKVFLFYEGIYQKVKQQVDKTLYQDYLHCIANFSASKSFKYLLKRNQTPDGENKCSGSYEELV